MEFFTASPESAGIPGVILFVKPFVNVDMTKRMFQIFFRLFQKFTEIRTGVEFKDKIRFCFSTKFCFEPFSFNIVCSCKTT
jgi:hypothetical protein